MDWAILFWFKLVMLETALLVVRGNPGVVGGEAFLGLPVVSQMFVNNTDFCSRILMEQSMGTCPRPPTMDNLDIDKILGSYYELGSTVGYKLRNDQLATACGRTNFSVEQPQYFDSNNVVLIDIQSSNVPILQGPQEALRHALRRVASLSSNACSHVARMCNIASNLSDISDHIMSMALSNVNNGISPEASLSLQNASITINDSVAGIRIGLDRIANGIGTLVAGIWSTLTQLDIGIIRDTTTAVQALLIPAARLRIDIAVAEVRQLEIFADNLAYVRRSIEGLGASNNSPLYQALLQASSGIENGVNKVISQVTNLEGAIVMIEEPLTQMAVSNDRSGSAYNSSAKVGNSTVIRSHGQIAVIRQRDGSTIVLTPQNFQVLALESSLQTSGSSQVYSALLIYTCTGGNAIRNDDKETMYDHENHADIVILSRTPVLPFETIVDFLNIAVGYGISSTTCDSPFIPTLQPPLHDCSNN